MGRLTAGVGVLALLPAGLALGSGPLNGDVAAYCVSPVTDRWVHVPYAALGRAVGPVGLDVGSFVAACAIVLLLGRSATVAVGAAAVVLPWAAFGEVDLPWVALVVAAVRHRPAWLGLAVALSPTALLAVPWVAARTRRWEGPVAAALAVFVLTVVSGGQWWTGERGVLQGGVLLPGRGLGLLAWHLPWLVVLAAPGSLRGVPWLLPLGFAPTDTPLWLLPALEVVSRAGSQARPAVLVQWVLALAALSGRAVRVERETAMVAEIAARWDARDGLVAPWTWGARISVAVTGDPYGLRWHPPGDWLRDQEAHWRMSPPLRVIVFPPK